jgi:hypothetical protein
MAGALELSWWLPALLREGWALVRPEPGASGS